MLNCAKCKKKERKSTATLAILSVDKGPVTLHHRVVNCNSAPQQTVHTAVKSCIHNALLRLKTKCVTV